MKRASFAAAIAAVALTTAACAPAATPAETAAPTAAPVEETLQLTVGAYATNYFGGRLQLGIDSGIFAKHGLEVEILELPNPAAVVPAVVSGEVAFGPSGPVSTLVAISQGLPVSVVSSNFLGPSSAMLEGTPGQGVFAHASQDVAEGDWAALEGATIGVLCLKCDGELLVRNSIDAAGGDSSTVEFVQLPVADAWEALKRGDLDAATINQPFTKDAFASDEVTWVGNQVDAMGDVWTPSLMLGNREWIDANPVATERFIAAMDELVRHIDGNEEELRASMQSRYNLTDEEAAKIVFPYIESPEIPRGVVQTALERSQQYGWVDGALTLEDLFLPGKAPQA